MSLNHKHLATVVLALGVLAGMARAEVVTSSEGAGFRTVVTGIGGEPVDVTGSILVVALVAPQTNPSITPSPCTIHLNLDGVKAIGRTTGFRYVANGSTTITTTIPLPATIAFEGTFLINRYPPGPILQPTPWFVALSGIFDASGNLVAVAITGIG